MYKFDTQLAYFKYNSILQTGILNVTWFVIDVNGQDEEGRGFTEDESKAFLNFLTNQPLNFPGDKNRHSCSEEEITPSCTIFSVLDQENINAPQNLTLRKTPGLNSPGVITKCMDIMLTDKNGNANHKYNLEFDVIGRANV